MDSSNAGEIPVAGSRENGNKPSGYPKGGKFLDWLSDY
jgi:hypothetical protein